MTHFDRIVVVDWSARSRPATGRDSIWIADRDRSGRTETCNPPTRAAANVVLADVLDDASNERVLIGVDFSLGYPAGTATAFGLGTGWSAMWDFLGEHVVDDDTNANNRFAVAAMLNAEVPGPGPFWGCPPSAIGPDLSATKPLQSSLPEWRATELALRRDGFRPFSCWQLLGAGSVGSQSLVGIAALERLRTGRSNVAFWPFTTGWGPPDLDGRGAVVAEVWPSMWAGSVDDHRPDETSVRDERQVVTVAGRLARADADGELATWFRPPDDVSLDVSLDDAVVAEEGWVLGAGHVRAERTPG